MTEPTETELDPREELASLVASTRALLEQYEASGADLLVTADRAAVAAFLAGQPMPPGRADAGAHAGARPEASRPAFRPAATPPSGAFSPPQRPAQIAAPPAHRDEPRPAIPPHEPSREMAPRSASHHAPSAPEPARPHAPAPPAEGPRRAPPAATGSQATPIPGRGAPPQPQLTSAAGVIGPASGQADDRRMRLALLAEEVRPCTKCPLCESRTQTVFARGNPFAEVCFVGEGPGADEDAQGEPFVGAAGRLLDKMVVAMGYKRDDVYICNIVKCRPPNNRKPEPSEMEACLPYLRDQLALVKPKVIVALGATAVTGLTGTTEGITRLRGKWKLYKGATPIMPTFHPAYLLRNPAAKREVWSDLQEVMKHLGKPVPRSGRSDE